ncbi:MAG: glycosyl hydrolase family 8 [Polyangiaceae bacterium]
MTSRSLLPLLPLLFTCLEACGASSDSAGSAERGPVPAGAGAASVAAGGKFAVGSAAGASNSLQGTGGAAGASSSAGKSGGYAPLPTVWNSAKSASVTDAQLQSEYATWKAAHVEACSNGSWVVVSDGNVVSEGIGYGMLLAVAMSEQTLFDGFWKYYQDHLDNNGLMNWKTGKCESPGNNNQNAATDADLDVAMALVQAAARWPSDGYLAKAQAQASKILQFESDVCDGRRVLRPGDAFGSCSDPNDKRINPSYFSPGYYKVFAHDFIDQASSWTALGDGSYQLYAIYQARMGNLVPDWSEPDGSDNNGSVYWYDACRTPWRVAVDYAWTGDTRAKTFLQNVSSWVDQNGGLPKAAQQPNSAFIGAFALAGGYEQGKFDGYVSAWLGAQVDDTAYYQGTLRVLYLLVAAGKFSSTL